MPHAPEAYLRSVFEHCASKPGVVAVIRRGQLVFRVEGRTFAFIGAADVTVRPGRTQRTKLRGRPGVRPARNMAWLGWITIGPSDQETLAVALQAIDASYELVSASARLGRGRGGRS